MKALYHQGLASMIHQLGHCRSIATTSLRLMGNPLLRISPYFTRRPRSFRVQPAGLATRLSDFAMNLHKSCGLMLLAVLCSMAFFCPGLIAPAHSESSPQTASSSGPTKRWVQFELSQAGVDGGSANRQACHADDCPWRRAGKYDSVVAICESIMFQAQTVTLEPDAESMVLKGTVTLEPIVMSRTSVQPRAARIQVTFARSRQDKLERFMRRVVYVTMDRSEPANESSELPPARPEESQSEDVILDEVKPAVEPVSTGALAEEDLVPFASPGEGKAYWQQVSHLISRSWARQIRGIRHAPSSETVKVRVQDVSQRPCPADRD